MLHNTVFYLFLNAYIFSSYLSKTRLTCYLFYFYTVFMKILWLFLIKVKTKMCGQLVTYSILYVMDISNMYGLEISTYNSKVYIFGHLYLRFFSYIRKRKRIACFSGINWTLINLRNLASHGKFEVLWTSFLWDFYAPCKKQEQKC